MFSARIYLPEMRMQRILSCLDASCLSVQKLPPPNICNRRDRNASHAFAAHNLVLGDISFCLCATDKRGISAKALASRLELSYESAWYLLVRIRRAMGDRDKKYMLHGIIEMDEAYLGGPKQGKMHGRSTERKKMIVAISKARFDHSLFLRLKMVPDVTTATLQEVVDTHISFYNSLWECYL